MVAVKNVGVKAPKSYLRRQRRKGGFGASQELEQEAVKCVIFSQADIDLLRLLRWGRHVLPSVLDGLFSQTTINNLVGLGYIKRHERSSSFVLTRRGNQFLNEELTRLPPDVPSSYAEVAIQRRTRLSRFLVTAYRSSADVFTTGVENLADTSSVFLPATIRGRGHNPWGNARIAALAHLGDLFCAVHYVCPGIGKLSLTDELIAFNNQAAHFPELQRSFLFAGDSYNDILDEITAVEEKSGSKLISYGEAYQSLTLPVHLLSCDDVGATQLQIMSIPDYRRRLTMAAVGEDYQPPPDDVAEWDAFYLGTPVIMAADMDLRRLETGLEQAVALGYDRVNILCLAEQGKAVLMQRYEERKITVRFFSIEEEALTEIMGHPADLHVPLDVPYMTEKGGYINAPLIQTAGKTGGHR